MDAKSKASKELAELKVLNKECLPAVYHQSKMTDIDTFTMNYIRDNRMPFPKYQARKGMRNAPYKNILVNYPES